MKKLLLFLLSLSLLGGHAFGVKRKRSDGDDGGQPTKRRKKQSVYDQYLGSDGKWHCPDCGYKGGKQAFVAHLSRKQHGHFKGKKKRKRGPGYDQYLKNGMYYCPEPGCDYVSDSATNLGNHFFRKRHGHLKQEKKQKKPSIYNQYRDENGIYRCPNCGYKGTSESGIRIHLSRERHGHLAEDGKQKKTSVYDQYRGVDRLFYCPEPNCGYVSKAVVPLSNHLSRERHGHCKKKKKKRRKSVYDQYRDDDGFFYCPEPGCDYVGTKAEFLGAHLIRSQHGRCKGKKRKTKKSVFDQYLGKDGKYYCSELGCGGVFETRRAIGYHLSRYQHGHRKGKIKKKRGPSIFDQYRGEDGFFYCPGLDCDYKGQTVSAIARHLFRTSHGHLKKLNLKNVVPQESISIAIDENDSCFNLTITPVLKQQDSDENSLSYALFNARCMLTDDIDLMYNQEKLNAFIAASQGQVNATAIIKKNKLLRPLASNLVVVDDISKLGSVKIDKSKQKIIILNLGSNRWIATKVFCKNGEKNIEVADALYAGFEDFEKLVNIAKRLM